MTEADRLLPCPFCGAEFDTSSPLASVVVHEKDCFFRKETRGRGSHGFGEHTPPERVEAWNRRAER